MVPATLQKLLRNQSQSASKIFTYFRQSRFPLPPSVLTQFPQNYNPIDVSPFPNHRKTDYLSPNHPFCGPPYPTFSFECFLNPNSVPAPLIRSESDEEAASDDSRIIRADSVKKKRKKKMNKHKLRKLRKRLRRKA
ncbi:hypothetical protein CDL12_09542 [Handroanthus impetiginosus]|uniref:Small ribosomal subunit protein mS38 n=1 Tax=Handroanthus impetiginosus TaxID=429701 RepID=A0A2G9HJW8_9LAMI|nr:hypothetical protein CDL12_09542 [Handroanthus impetiginosus]